MFCLDRAGITGDDGPSHHGVLDLVLFTKIPTMTVLAPSSYEEVGVMLHDALDITDGPVLIRWPKKAVHVGPDEVGSGLRGRRVRSGRDVCILAVGKMLHPALEAADALAGEGVEATVWDVRCVKPADREMIADACDHPAVVTVEDGYREGGAGSLLANAITECCDDRTVPRVEILGVPTQYLHHATIDTILARLGLDAAGIAGSVRRAVRAKRLISAGARFPSDDRSPGSNVTVPSRRCVPCPGRLRSPTPAEAPRTQEHVRFCVSTCGGASAGRLP